MAPGLWRGLIPTLPWGLCLFLSFPVPVWLQSQPCHTCRDLVNSFSKGLERTVRDNFGGGNTAWEEEKLSKYKDSETRLVEVLEAVCSKSDFECHQLLEQSEELVETWWFHKQHQAPDLFQWLCMDSLKVCCPPGTYGPSCLACFGPCSRCSGPKEGNCLRCKRGWALHQQKCVDIDECGTEMATCRANQFCVNTDGSYECRDCAKACAGCMGAGPARCKRCSVGYRRDGAKCLDVDECEGEVEVCTGAHELCENTDGSYRCACVEGYERSQEGCVPRQPEEPKPGGFFSEVTDDEVVVLQQMFFGVIICALATLAAKGDMVFTAIFIGAVAAMAGYWLSERSDRVLDGFIKGR